MKYHLFNRGLASVARATAVAAALCFAASAPATAGDQPPTSAPPAKGEFDNSSAMDLASGQLVKTDCSVNWTAPDGKIYCFSTEGSKEAFLKNPDENSQKAREFFLAKDQSAQAAPPAGETAAPAAKGPAKEFTEDDVNAAVKKTVDARSKDGVFVFHDPKLDQDLNLLYEQ
jgi:YHS domain-containing protein